MGELVRHIKAHTGNPYSPDSDFRIYETDTNWVEVAPS